jgi:hypothetical protein
MKYVRDIFDMIFSVYTFILLIVVGFVFLMIQVDKVEELREKEAAYCYSQNMTVVTTDAGRRCALPSSLIAIK